METELATWHFVVAGGIFALLGAICHVTRAVFNVFPDKLSDTPAVNILVSSDYSWADHFWGTEFDDAGYYRFSVFGGLGAMLLVDGAGIGIAALIEAGAGAFVDLFWQRVTAL